MPVEVIVPKVDMDMESAIIESWKVEEGDRVAKGDILFEIITNKAAMEVDAPASGVVAAITGQTGEPIAVGTVVALILGEGEAAPTTIKETAAAQEKYAPSLTISANLARVVETHDGASGLRATPLARKIARDLGIDLALIVGTGPRGRIAEKDVRAAASKMADHAGKLVPFDAIRRIAAARLTESVRNAPHFYMTAEIEMTEFTAALDRLRAAAVAGSVAKPSPTVLIAWIVARVLARHPMIGASVEGAAMRLSDRIDIAIAVDHEGSLMTPVLRDVDNKTPGELVAEFRALTQAIRDRTIPPRDMTGGVFTISSLAMHGVDSFTAIINPPQSAILAVGRTVERPVGRDGQIVLRPMANFSLSSDHRIVDGVTAARFMADLRAAIEGPFGAF